MNIVKSTISTIAVLACLSSIAFAQNETSTYSGKAVFGVDVYGRWLIGLDSDGDQAMDRYWRYAGEQIAKGPWFETEEVSVTQGYLDTSLQRIVLESVNSEFRIELWNAKNSVTEGLFGASPLSSRGFRQEFESASGAIIAMSGSKIQFEGFDPIDLNSWPYGFTRPDAVYDPQTQQMSGCLSREEWPVPNCDAGGSGASSCSISGCPTSGSGNPSGCSVSCSHGCYACCSCVSGWFGGQGAACGCINEGGIY